VKLKRLPIEPWRGVPALNRVIKMINIRVCRLALARERGSYAGNCFSQQERIIV